MAGGSPFEIGNISANTRHGPADFRNNFRLLSCVAFGLITLFVSAIALTVWGLRSDAIRDADNDTGNIAIVLSGQIERSFQSVDLLLSDIRDLAKSQMMPASDAVGEGVRSREFYRALGEQLTRLPQADGDGDYR